MQKNKHPEYRKVLYVDTSTGFKFVCGSTVQTEQEGEFEGQTYPMTEVSISCASHPFFTGSSKMVDSEGRVERFNRRYGKKKA